MNNKEKDPVRNRPAEERTNNDPNVRDQDARQPDVNTISGNKDYEEANEDLTKTASDNFREDNWANDADTRFDEVDEKKSQQ
jgi:hypothetical protein